MLTLTQHPSQRNEPEAGARQQQGSQVLRELREDHGLGEREVYLAPLLPLFEIAWMGQRPGKDGIAFIEACAEYVNRRLGRLVGAAQILDEAQLQRFMARLLHGKTPPAYLERMARLGQAFLSEHCSAERRQAHETALWHCCYRVASSNPSHLPNPQQWKRLLDLAPTGICWPDIRERSHQDVCELFCAVEQVWDCV